METLSKNKLKYLRKFQQKKTRKREKKCLVEGEKLCREALANGYAIETLVYAAGCAKNMQNILHHHGVKEALSAPERALVQLSEVEAPQEMVGLVSFPEPEEPPGENRDHRRYLALDGVADPGNLGAIIRTASWYGWNGVLCGAGCVEITSGKALRSSMGAVFHLPAWENLDLAETLEALRAKGFTVYGSAARGGEPAAPLAHRAALVIGSEARGISPGVLKACNHLVTIPGSGRAESLNAAVSAGILMDRCSRDA